MADTDNRALEAFEAFMKTEAPSDYDASNGDAWYVWKACWAAALASRPAEVDDEGYQSVPTEITREMMRAIQTQSELGTYACSNLSGAYNLINELWRIALSEAPSHTTNKEK